MTTVTQLYYNIYIIYIIELSYSGRRNNNAVTLIIIIDTDY